MAIGVQYLLSVRGLELLYVPHILIVEDEPAIRDFLGGVLADNGYSITALGTAREALRAVQDVDFEAIIVDMSLPDADGIDVVRQIHSDVPYVPVLAISGMMVADLLRAARSAGAAATLMKPTTSGKVRQAIHQLLEPRSESGAITAAA
jgi:CheY-like chemotaxis protein